MNTAARPQPWMHQHEQLVADVSTYIDVSVISSEAAGILLALATFWGVVLFNRLWQSSLRSDAAEAIAAAEARGLRLRAPGLGPSVAAVGSIGSAPVEVRWVGGWRGARTVVRQGARRQTVPLVRTADELGQLLAP